MKKFSLPVNFSSPASSWTSNLLGSKDFSKLFSPYTLFETFLLHFFKMQLRSDLSPQSWLYFQGFGDQSFLMVS